MFWPKMAVLGTKKGTGGAMLTPNELVLTFGRCYLCATFGANRSRNATVRVRTDNTRAERQTEFIISSMLYSTAMGQL